MFSKYEIILKLAELKSISKTADYFHYTQPAISQTCKALEEELGIMLFHRVPKGIVLSSEGERILPLIKDICQAQERLAAEVAQMHNYQTATIKIGAYACVTRNILAPVINQFKESYPNVSIELWQGGDDKLLRQLHEGIFDFAVMSDPFKSNTQYTNLLDDEFVLAMPVDHPMADRPVLSLKEVGDEKFMTVRGGFDRIVNHEMAKNNISPNVVCYFDEDETIISMVSAGFGIAVVPYLLVANTGHNIKAVPLEHSFYRHIGIATAKRKQQFWAQEKFIDFLKSKAREIRDKTYLTND